MLLVPSGNLSTKLQWSIMSAVKPRPLFALKNISILGPYDKCTNDRCILGAQSHSKISFSVHWIFNVSNYYIKKLAFLRLDDIEYTLMCN